MKPNLWELTMDVNGDKSKQQGKVKWFNNARGYGFIECSTTQEDIFVHYHNIIGDGYKSLSEGQMVEFTLAKGDKGLQAEEVKLLELAE